MRWDKFATDKKTIDLFRKALESNDNNTKGLTPQPLEPILFNDLPPPCDYKGCKKSCCIWDNEGGRCEDHLNYEKYPEEEDF